MTILSKTSLYIKKSEKNFEKFLNNAPPYIYKPSFIVLNTILGVASGLCLSNPVAGGGMMFSFALIYIIAKKIFQKIALKVEKFNISNRRIELLSICIGVNIIGFLALFFIEMKMVALLFMLSFGFIGAFFLVFFLGYMIVNGIVLGVKRLKAKCYKKV
jgi:hypothetical protein